MARRVEGRSPLSAGKVEVKRLYFIRHAEAQGRELWHHDDALRPLTERGYRQADAIARALGRARVERVLSSRAFRCLDTVRPLAHHLGVGITRHDDLFEGASAADALALMRRLRVRRAALCTHGDVMGDVLEHLEEQGVDLDGGLRLAKGAYWELELDDRGEVRCGTYHPAPRAA